MKDNIQEIIDHALKGGKFRFYDTFYYGAGFIGKLRKIIIRNGKLRYSSSLKDEVCVYSSSLKDEVYVETSDIEIIKRLKDPIAIMQALTDGGWESDNNGNFIHESKPAFVSKMWHDCGKIKLEWKVQWTVDPSWIEEV